jgi:hypothetical protein
MGEYKGAYRLPKPVKVTNTITGEITFFRAIMTCMEHYDLQYNQINKWLNRKTPVLQGPRKGLSFEYATEEEVLQDDFDRRILLTP